MKVVDKNKNKKDKVKKNGGVNKSKPKKEQVLVVAQEIKYARWLSGNDKKTRDRVLKALKKWIINCFEKGYEFKEEDFTRVWKGLFYAVWMSDKPLIQEELCENISQVLDLFPADHLKHALLMIKAGFKTLATEWYGIDHHRMDKFLMLVRRYLRGSLRCLDRCEWSLSSCQKYAKMLSGTDGLFAIKSPHYVRNATSMLLHFTDCFLEELAKVSRGKLPPESMSWLLRPFVQYTCAGPAAALCSACRRLLTGLLRQSELGLRYEDKTRAWKRMGCPAGGPDALEPISDDDDDDDAEMMENGDAGSDVNDDDRPRPLDPRAGRVDVELPLLPVPASLLADMLRDMLAGARSRAHRRVKICLQRFEALSAGEYPLPVSVPEVTSEEVTIRPRRSAQALQLLEHKLKVDADELKLRGLSRKHRKRLLRKSRAGLSIVEDIDDHKRALSKQSNNAEWVVESTENKAESTEKDTSDKENQHKSKKHSKQSPQKRKNTGLQNGDVKKMKLEKNNKNKIVNIDNSLANNKSTKKDKINKVKQAKCEDITKAETNVILKQKDLKDSQVKDTKTKEIITKEVKNKTAKNQPQMITHKSESSKSENAVKSVINRKPNLTESKTNKTDKKMGKPALLVNKVKNFQKHLPGKEKVDVKQSIYESPKKVKFALKNNSMQKPVDYYKSVKQSPNIPFDSSRKPSKTNLKPSTPSPINPFFKKKLRMKH